jgi:hypothetical protein
LRWFRYGRRGRCGGFSGRRWRLAWVLEDVLERIQGLVQMMEQPINTGIPVLDLPPLEIA